MHSVTGDIEIPQSVAQGAGRRGQEGAGGGRRGQEAGGGARS